MTRKPEADNQLPLHEIYRIAEQLLKEYETSPPKKADELLLIQNIREKTRLSRKQAIFVIWDIHRKRRQGIKPC